MEKSTHEKIYTSSIALLFGIISSIAIGLLSFSIVFLICWIEVLTNVAFFFLPAWLIYPYISDDFALSYLFPVPCIYFLVFLPIFMTYLFYKKFDEIQESPTRRTFVYTTLISIVVFYCGFLFAIPAMT